MEQNPASSTGPQRNFLSLESKNGIVCKVKSCQVQCQFSSNHIVNDVKMILSKANFGWDSGVFNVDIGILALLLVVQMNMSQFCTN